MAVMFTASTDLGSSDNTSRIIEPFLRFIAPSLAPESIALIHAAIRKTAHVTEYAILAALLFRALRMMAAHRPSAPEWRVAFLAWLLAAGFATSDEIHQTFVASRGPSASDVLIDATGAALGLALVVVAPRMRRRRAPA
jgi:VanZ family protein